MLQPSTALRDLQGDSALGWEDAAQAVVNGLSAQGLDPHVLCITQMRARVEGGRIVRYHVTLQACCGNGQEQAAPPG